MLALFFSTVVGDLDRSQNFLFKDEGGFHYEIQDASSLPDIITPVLVTEDIADNANITEILDNLLGEGDSIPLYDRSIVAEPQDGDILVLDLDVDEPLEYDEDYSFCILGQGETESDPTEVFECQDAPPLEWGTIDVSGLREGHDNFKLKWDIHDSYDASGNGPLYFIVSPVDEDLTVQQIKSGCCNNIATTSSAHVDENELEDDFKIELQDDVDLDGNQTLWISSVLQTPDGPSNVVKERFEVDEYDWGWELAVVLGVIIGTCLTIVILAAAVMCLSDFLKDCC